MYEIVEEIFFPENNGDIFCCANEIELRFEQTNRKTFRFLFREQIKPTI